MCINAFPGEARVLYTSELSLTTTLLRASIRMAIPDGKTWFVALGHCPSDDSTDIVEREKCKM